MTTYNGAIMSMSAAKGRLLNPVQWRDSWAVKCLLWLTDSYPFRAGCLTWQSQLLIFKHPPIIAWEGAKRRGERPVAEIGTGGRPDWRQAPAATPQ